VPNRSLEFLGFAEGIGMAPGREGDELNCPGFFGRIAMDRIASSSPNDPWLLLKLVGEAGSRSFSPWFDLNKSLVLIKRPICGDLDWFKESSLPESSSDNPSVLKYCTSFSSFSLEVINFGTAGVVRGVIPLTSLDRLRESLALFNT